MLLHTSQETPLAVSTKDQAQSSSISSAERCMSSPPTEIQGVGHCAGGWNKRGEYTVYFDVQLDFAATATETWAGKGLFSDKDAQIDEDQALGASFDFAAHKGQVLSAKVGISLVSASQAKQNNDEETPSWNFDALKNAASAKWDDALSAIELKGESALKAHAGTSSALPHDADACGSYRRESLLAYLVSGASVL